MVAVAFKASQDRTSTIEGSHNRMARTVSVLLMAFTDSQCQLRRRNRLQRSQARRRKGKQADARLIFSDSNKNLVVRVADRDFVTVPTTNSTSFRMNTPRNIASLRGRG